MRRKKLVVILGIVALLALIIVAPFTNIFEKAYASDSSTIAGVSVGSLSEDEIRTTLSDAIANWSQNPPQIEGGGASLTIDPAVIEFDIDATLAIYDSLTSKAWYAVWESKNPVHIPIEVKGLDALKNEIENMGAWNVEETFALALQHITNLKSEPVEAIVQDTSILEAERLTFIIQEIPETAKEVYDIAQILDGSVIGIGESFSLLEAVGSLADNSNVEGLSFVASLLYHNALHTNTVITERHAQPEIPTYLEPGLEAYINPATSKNLSFTNDSSVPLKLKLTVEGQKLKAEVYSSAKTSSVSVQVTQSGEVKPRTIVRYTDDLSVGSQRLLQEGEKGARVTVFQTIDGFEKQISRDYYPPKNRIIVKSSRVPAASSGTGSNNDNGGTSPNGTPTDDGDDTLDLDNNGLPDINQGKGNEPKVDKDGNVIYPDGTTTNKSGDVITSGGSAS